jgi:hypothetical protein|nr:MAG TPA: hypothetical protein [Caudoviricetes sp.]
MIKFNIVVWLVILVFLLGLLVYISSTIGAYLHMTYLRAKLYIARNNYLCLRLLFTRDYLIYLKVLHNMHILKFIGKSSVNVSFNNDKVSCIFKVYADEKYTLLINTRIDGEALLLNKPAKVDKGGVIIVEDSVKCTINKVSFPREAKKLYDKYITA